MTIRVVQWGSGNVGRHALRAVLARSDMKLVGLYVTNPDKAGRDAGEIADLAPMGVKATNSVEEIEALEADVVLHMPLPSLVYGDDVGADVDNFVRLLASGKSVVTTVGYMYPQRAWRRTHGRARIGMRGGRQRLSWNGVQPGLVR